MTTSRWTSVGRMRAPNMFDMAVQTNKTSPIKHENKRNVLSCLIECLIAFKFFQTRPNTIKHDQTSPNKVAKRQNVWSPNNVWRCLVAKHFPFGQALIHQLIPEVFFPTLPGSKKLGFARVFILEAGHFKFYYQPRTGIWIPQGTAPEHLAPLWFWSRMYMMFSKKVWSSSPVFSNLFIFCSSHIDHIKFALYCLYDVWSLRLSEMMFHYQLTFVLRLIFW